MDHKLLAIIGLRGTALALSLAGQQRAAEALYTLADALEAGRAIDDHLGAVAAKLKSRPITSEDWEDVVSRIEQDSERLQNS